MEKKYETEVVKGVEGNRGLNLAMGELKKNKRKKKISKICSIVVPILIAFIVFGTPILMHYSNRGKHIYWKDMITATFATYEDLIKEDSVTIKELNKKNNAHFYWIDNATITGTYLLKENDAIALIEEHYIVNDVECVIYIKNKNTKFNKINVSNILLNKYFILENYDTLQYNFFDENNCYAELSADYVYQFSISSTDTTTVESIFSNLTNN